MSMVTICDGGCGACSPDFNHGRPNMGPHVANGWTAVQILNPADRNHVGVRWAQAPSRGYLFCEKCWPRIAEALTPLSDGAPLRAKTMPSNSSGMP